MNSIFLRIYAGVLLLVLLIGLLAYGAVQLINDQRAGVYRESMARGTFYLMAKGLQRQTTEEEREARRQLLTRLLGAEVTLHPLSGFELDKAELRRLNEGKVVMRLSSEEAFADIMYRLPDEDTLLRTRMDKVSEQQARATAILLLDELAQHPSDQWDREFARIQKQFGYPLARQPRDRLGLDDEQIQRLERREVVLALDEGAGRRAGSVNVYAPIGNTGEVLVLGPLRLFEWLPTEMSVLVGVIGLSAMGIGTYFLVRPLQTRLRRLEGSVRRLGSGDLDVRAEVRGNDAIGQLAATFNGMTEHIRRLIESQREMTRAVSHELRTPVARLRFGLEMLAGNDDAGQRRDKLDELDRDIDQLDELIDEILTFARLEEGAPSLDMKSVRVPRLMQQICAELTPISGAIAIQVLNDWEQLPPELWHADAEERYLHRILQNLVTNGLRYAASRVTLAYRVAGELAVLEVSDDGPGISPADRARIFKPFARLDSSRNRGSGGYGLGLSIVQKIVDWHGGRIEVTDSPEGGALFRVIWPRHQRGQHVLGNDQAV